jgi:hypothetical protein
VLATCPPLSLMMLTVTRDLSARARAQGRLEIKPLANGTDTNTLSAVPGLLQLSNNDCHSIESQSLDTGSSTAIAEGLQGSRISARTGPGPQCPRHASR